VLLDGPILRDTLIRSAMPVSSVSATLESALLESADSLPSGESDVLSVLTVLVGMVTGWWLEDGIRKNA